MPVWIGFDSVNHSYDGSGVSTNCAYWNNQLATYVAAHYPGSKFFGRYFTHSIAGYKYSAPAETGPFSVAGFHYLVPIAAPGESRYTVDNLAMGQSDGKDVCDSIVRAIQAGGMGFPPGGRLYVYLNIESNFELKLNYWKGWSAAVYQYVTPWGSLPFFPCVYANGCRTCSAANAKTADVLTTNRSGLYFCWGHWAATRTAANCSWCNNAPTPSPNGNIDVIRGADGWALTWHYWQHGLNDACRSCDSCRPNVDNDQSNGVFNMMDYCLNVY